MSELAERLEELEPHQQSQIVVHCHLGGRSLQVAHWLRQQGFARAQSMAGGIEAWSLEVDKSIPRLVDLMFSCRVQSKRVEHAFLCYLLRRYRDAGCDRFEALYRKTERNAPAGRVFDDLEFEVAELTDGVTLYRYDLTREIPNDRIIAVSVES